MPLYARSPFAPKRGGIMLPVRSTMGEIDWNSIISDITGAFRSIVGQPQPYYNPATGTYTYPPNYNPITGQYNVSTTPSTGTIILYGLLGFAAYKLFLK